MCIRLDSRGSIVLEYQRTEDECASNETSLGMTDEFFVYLCTLFYICTQRNQLYVTQLLNSLHKRYSLDRFVFLVSCFLFYKCMQFPLMHNLITGRRLKLDEMTGNNKTQTFELPLRNVVCGKWF